MPVEDPAKNGLVINVVRAGYRFQARVLRPAQVLVGHHPNPTPPPEETGEDGREGSGDTESQAN